MIGQMRIGWDAMTAIEEYILLIIYLDGRKSGSSLVWSIEIVASKHFYSIIYCPSLVQFRRL